LESLRLDCDELAGGKAFDDPDRDASSEMVVTEPGCSDMSKGARCGLRRSGEGGESFDRSCNVAGCEAEILVAPLCRCGDECVVHQSAQMHRSGSRAHACSVRKLFRRERAAIHELSQHSNASWIAYSLRDASDVWFDRHHLMMNEVFLRDKRVLAGKNVGRCEEEFLQDLAIELENRPGALAEMGEALARAGVSVEGGGAWVVGGKGAAHFLVADGDAARKALEFVGIRVIAQREVLVQKLKQDVPGQLGKLTRRMADAGVNIEVLYSDHDHQMILVVDDYERGKEVSEQWMRERELERNAP
jgi:hypothetical protein